MNHSLHSTQKQINNSETAYQVGGRLQRKCACGKPITASGECTECRKKRLRLQRKAVTTAITPKYAPPIVHEVLRQPGWPLDSTTRDFMEPRFGHNFSNVKIHSDSKAADSANKLHAKAYTVGSHIVFGKNKYLPGSENGKKLLAHELTHYIQQKGSPTIKEKIDANPQLEKDASSIANEILSNNLPSTSQCSFQYIARKPENNFLVSPPVAPSVGTPGFRGNELIGLRGVIPKLGNLLRNLTDRFTYQRIINDYRKALPNIEQRRRDGFHQIVKFFIFRYRFESRFDPARNRGPKYWTMETFLVILNTKPKISPEKI